jgi:O-antigen/teichoic acid export membrane protein
LAYVAALGAAWIAGYPASLRRLLSLAGVLLLVDALGNMGHNQLVARERMVICAGIAVAHATLLVALSALALGVGGGLAGLYLAAVLAGVARTIAYWIAAWRVGCRPAWPVDRALLRSLPAEGLPLAALAFLTLAAFHGDKLITTALLGTAATGQLTAAAVVVFGVVELFSTVPLVAVLPLMSRAHATGGEGLPGILARLGRLTLLVGLPLAAATSLLAAPLTATLFGGAFARTADVLRILIWAALAAMLANIGAQVLIVRGEQGRLLGARATGLVVGWGLTLALLPHLGVTGAAPAALAAEILVLLLLARACDLPRTWWAGLRGRAARLGAAGLTLGIVVVLLRGVHPVLALTAGLIAYAALVRLSGALAPGDWAHLRRLVRGRPAEDPIALERRPTGR